MKCLSFAACSMFLVSIPAAAQDGTEPSGARTAESANKFLSEFLSSRRPLTLGIVQLLAGRYARVRNGMSAEISSAVSGEAISWTPLDRCRSRLGLGNVRVLYRSEFGWNNSMLDAPAQQVIYDIDWTRVIGVGATSEAGFVDVRTSATDFEKRAVYTVGIAYPDSLYTIPSLMFDTLDDAKRVAFAMEFLKEQCAPTSETGF